MNPLNKKQYMFSNKDLVRLIIPLIIEQMLAVLVGIADSIMIANVGESAVSGVSLVDGVILLFIMIFSAMGAGGAVVAGQYLGYKDEKGAGTVNCCRGCNRVIFCDNASSGMGADRGHVH